ncbi:hypothetical protein OIU79_002593 [Salix purpurea]|uniref:Uncharacterized protein n=1 Tax=Salix purpurea TaxID=77065 RepID=A0A9Q0UK42_SALPP|nr:hypothetical protein OIU79_002593 [Salix purpurea]
MKLLGPNWLLELGSGPVSPELAAAGTVPSLAAADSDPSPSQLLSLQLHSPSFSEMFGPVNMNSPRDSEYEGSSAYNSDSSSHYGSPLTISELKARPPSPVSSAPALAEGPSDIPPASPLAAMDSGPVLQVGLAPVQGLLPSDQAAAHGLLPSDQAVAHGLHLPAPTGDLTRRSCRRSPPKNKPPAPMNPEAATADYEWQLVPKKADQE